MSKPWRLNVQHGPNGEAGYAWVFGGDGALVGTFRTHDAELVVKSVNALEATERLVEEIEKALKPFADFGDMVLGADDAHQITTMHTPPVKPSITAGDLRRAHAALASIAEWRKP